jgi:proline iminopeptidase
VISGGPGFTTDYELGIMRGSKVKGLMWIFLEQRGTPRARLANGKASDFTMGRYVADFDALRKQLCLAKWNVIGHSWGSMVAHGYLAAHPDRVSSVVFLGNVGPDLAALQPAADNIDRLLSPEELEAEHKAGGTATTGPASDKDAFDLFMVQLSAYFYSRKNCDAHRSMFEPGSLVGNTQNVVFPQLVKQGWDVRKPISKFRGPVLALQGRQDILGETPCWEDKLAMPQTDVEFVERSGHMPWMEEPKPFFKVLDAFLARRTH